MKELDVKRSFRALWPGWVGAYEIAFGGDIGAPDLQVLVGKLPHVLPIELKRGWMRSSGVVVPDRVRAAQVGWHRDFIKAGGRSILLIGVANSPFDNELYVVQGKDIPRWASGFIVGKEAWRINPIPVGKDIKMELEDWLLRMKMFKRSEL